MRLYALDLLCSAYQLPGHLPRAVLDAISEQLPVFHAETDAHARDAFVSIVNRIFNRIQTSILRLQKTLGTQLEFRRASPYAAENDRDHDQNHLTTQLGFLDRYIQFLVAELKPTSSYQRHIIALKVLKHFFASDLQDQLSVHPPFTKLQEADYCRRE